MDLSDKKMLASAIKRLSSTLDVTVDSALQEAYLKGEHPTLLSYEKLEKSELQVPVILKYLLGVSSFLAQPGLSYYDIRPVGRIVPLTVALDRAIATLAKKRVGGYPDRLNRLVQATNFDEFESVLFEIVVAAKYAALPDAKATRFLEEGSKKQPDIETVINRRTYYVECKKPDRRNSASVAMQKAIAPKFKRMFKMFAKDNISAVIEVTFLMDPSLADEIELKDMAFASLESRAPILSPIATVHAKPISPKPLKDYALFPSPGYFFDHFGYDPEGDWHGLIPCLLGEWKAPSWLNEVRWEAAVKWKVTNDDQLWKIKKLGYNLIFKGIEQLNQAGQNSILHFWFERDRALGHRQRELMHFFETLKKRNSEKFAWIIFNDVSPSLSRFGRFDFIEHSHPISGVHRATQDSPVQNVFVSDEDTMDGLGEFGVGHTLPPIDVDDESWKTKKRKSDT